MNESLTDYAAALSGSDMDTLDDIITHKYRKFLKFFSLVRDHTSEIKKLEYEFTAADTLAISITFTKKVSLSDKMDMICDMEKSGYKIDATYTGKKVKLKIKYPE